MQQSECITQPSNVHFLKIKRITSCYCEPLFPRRPQITTRLNHQAANNQLQIQQRYNQRAIPTRNPNDSHESPHTQQRNNQRAPQRLPESPHTQQRNNQRAPQRLPESPHTQQRSNQRATPTTPTSHLIHNSATSNAQSQSPHEQHALQSSSPVTPIFRRSSESYHAIAIVIFPRRQQMTTHITHQAAHEQPQVQQPQAVRNSNDPSYKKSQNHQALLSSPPYQLPHLTIIIVHTNNANTHTYSN